jgi:hypothetical protein
MKMTKVFAVSPSSSSRFKLVGIADGVEIEGPIFKQYRIARIVRGEIHRGGIGRASQVGDHPLPKGGATIGTSLAQFASGHLNLHEERLALASTAPIITIVHRLVPFEVIVGLAELFPRPLPLLAFRRSTRRLGGDASTDARIVAGCLEELRDRDHPFRQVNFQFASPAAMLVRADGGLIHPGNQGRAARRTDRGGDIGLQELNPLLGQPIDMRCLDGSLAVTCEVRRHVIDHEP